MEKWAKRQINGNGTQKLVRCEKTQTNNRQKVYRSSQIRSHPRSDGVIQSPTSPGYCGEERELPKLPVTEVDNDDVDALVAATAVRAACRAASTDGDANTPAPEADDPRYELATKDTWSDSHARLCRERTVRFALLLAPLAKPLRGWLFKLGKEAMRRENGES